MALRPHRAADRSVYWTTYMNGALDGGVIEGGQVFKMTPK